MKKRFLSLALALVMVMTFLPVTKAEAAVAYDVDAAIAYAKAHWNDGVGMCAEFVSKCVKAGGINMKVIATTTSCLNTISSASGLPILEVKLDANGYATQAANKGILSAGDPVLQRCTNPNCPDTGKAPHIMFCGGFDSNGRATFYGHAAATNNKVQKLNVNEAYNHTKACTMKAYTVHLASLDKGSSTTPTTPSTPAAKATFSKSVDADYKQYSYVTNTNAGVVTKITKLGGVACTQMGLYLYDASGKLIKKHADSISQSWITPARTSPFHTWYDINKEVGVTLTPGTTYKYQFFGLFDGKEIKDSTYSFTTTGTPPAKTFTAKFYLNSDLSALTTQSVTQGKAYGTLPTPYSKDGYTFAGYYTAQTGGSQVTASTVFNGSSDITLYPRYTQNPVVTPAAVTVYYYADGRCVATQNTVVGDRYYSTPYERDGFTFTGWYSLANGGTEYTGATITASSPRFLYGHYEMKAPEQHTVYLYANGAIYKTFTATNGSTYGTLPTPSLNGYEFLGWYTSPTGGSKITSSTKVNLSVSQTLYARFEAVETGGTITLQIGNPRLTVNGSSKYIDDGGTVPVIRNSRTLLPVRAVFEAMGGTVGWDGDSRIVSLTKDGKTLYLQIDNSFCVDSTGRYFALDSAPIILNSRTMLPIRFVVEYFGGTVGWNGTTQTVTIQY